jgi:hypothetical protein
MPSCFPSKTLISPKNKVKVVSDSFKLRPTKPQSNSIWTADEKIKYRDLVKIYGRNPHEI